MCNDNFDTRELLLSHIKKEHKPKIYYDNTEDICDCDDCNDSNSGSNSDSNYNSDDECKDDVDDIDNNTENILNKLASINDLQQIEQIKTMLERITILKQSIIAQNEKMQKKYKTKKVNNSNHKSCEKIKISEDTQNLSKYSHPKGTFLCPICGQKFKTPYYLGEHFTEDHQSYHTQSNLDKLSPKDSFCGFEIMEEIRMIYIPRREKEQIVFINGVCDICCEKYACVYPTNSADLDQIICGSTVEPNYVNDYEDNNKLINSSQIESLYCPITMTCCGNSCCHKCIKTNATEQGNIVCMFCKMDHSVRSVENIKYISIIEPHSNFDNLSWQEWWSKNDRINILTNWYK